MTAFTATQSGLWSASSTWGNAGHPAVNGDTFSIPSGITVTLDLDFSGLTAGFGASTCAGTIAYATSGTPALQMNGNLTGAGGFQINNGLGVSYPVGVVAKYIQRSGTMQLTGQIDIRGVDPVHLFARLSQAANAGDTVLHVDTDLTQAGDSGTNLWANGAIVHVDNNNKAIQTEEFTLNGNPTSTTVTISAGLANAKNAGAYVILISRNVQVSATSTAVSIFSSAGNSSSYFAAQFRTFSQCFTTPANSCTYGGSFSNGGTGIGSAPVGCTFNFAMSGMTVAGVNESGGGHNNTFNGIITACVIGRGGGNNDTLNGVIAGNTRGWGLPTTPGNTVTGVGDAISSTGVIDGNGTGLLGCINIIIAGTLKNNNSAVLGCSGRVLSSAVFSNNSSDLNGCPNMTGYGIAASISGITGNNVGIPTWAYTEIIDNSGVSGGYQAVTRGGSVVDVASPVYDSTRARSYWLSNSNAQWCFLKRSVLVPAGGSINVRCYIQKSVTGIASADRPRLWITRADKEPLYSGSPDSETVMTDSLNTWEVLTATLTNNTTEDWVYNVLVLCRNMGGNNVYCDPIIRVSSYIPQSMEGALS